MIFDPLSKNKLLRVRYDVLLFSVVCLVTLTRYYQPFPVDDAAFFFRYADHIANGFGYRWNIDEIAPVGASATLWPPLISLFQWLLGIPTQQAALLLAVMLLGGTYLLAFNVTTRLWGLAGSCILLLCLLASPLVAGYAMGGMETPLTVLLLMCAICVVVYQLENKLLVAAVAAALILHKVDLAPWAIGLFVAAKANPFSPAWRRALALFVSMIIIDVLLIWLSTGHVLPISIMTKVLMSAGLVENGATPLPHTWFLKTVLLSNGYPYVLHRLPITVMFLLSLPVLFLEHRRLLYFVLIGLLGQSVVYTILPPTEAFSWYATPAVFVISVTAPAFCTSYKATAWKVASFSLALYLGIAAVSRSEATRSWFVANSNSTEADRSLAGLWVAEHTPDMFRVSTAWGNPAFFSRRKVYDFSGLNMPGNHGFEHIKNTYKPEIIILCYWRTGQGPGDAIGPVGYTAVKTFASAFKSKQDDFFTVVFARDDVIDEIPAANILPPS